MQLEDYFDFLKPDDIRIRGHRVGIESILYEYVYRSRTPEEIAKQFETLTLDQVYDFSFVKKAYEVIRASKFDPMRYEYVKK